MPQHSSSAKESKIIDILLSDGPGQSTTPTPQLEQMVPASLSKGWMRIAATLASKGHSIASISELCEVEEARVISLTKEAWWIELVIEKVKLQPPQSSTESLTRMAGPLAVMTLVQVMQTGGNDNAKVAAAKAILNVYIPKSLNNNISSGTDVIEDEARKLNERINQLTTNGHSSTSQAKP